MKLNLHPKGIPKQEPLGADTPLKKGGVVVGCLLYTSDAADE